MPSNRDIERKIMAALVSGTVQVGEEVSVEELARFRELEAENARLLEALSLISNGANDPVVIADAALLHEQRRATRRAITPTKQAQP